MKAVWNTNEIMPKVGEEIIILTNSNGNHRYSKGVFYINENENGIYPQVLHDSSTPTSWQYVKY